MFVNEIIIVLGLVVTTFFYNTHTHKVMSTPIGVEKLSAIDLKLTDLDHFSEFAEKSDLFSISEFTHGSSNSDKLRFSIAKYLIQQKNYRLIFFEWSKFFTLKINSELNNPTCSFESVKQATKYLSIVYKSEEYLYFLNWICEWKSHPDQIVQFYGFDVTWEDGFDLFQNYIKIPVLNSKYLYLSSYLEQAETNCMGYAISDFDLFKQTPEYLLYKKGSPRDSDKHKKCLAALSEISKNIKINETKWQKILGLQKFYLMRAALRNLTVMEYVYNQLHKTDPYKLQTMRDSAQSENSAEQWLLQPHQKVVFLAHNYHSLKDQPSTLNPDWPNVVNHLSLLKKIFINSKFYVLGTISYRFSYIGSSAFSENKDPDSVEFFLHKLNLPCLYIKTDNSFLTEKTNWKMSEFTKISPEKQFDGLIYIDESISSTPLVYN